MALGSYQDFHVKIFPGKGVQGPSLDSGPQSTFLRTVCYFLRCISSNADKHN
jgi:hypothetical protein